MAKKLPSLNINFKFVTTKGGSASIKSFKSQGENWARMVVRDVAISAADSNRLKMQRTFVKNLEKVAKTATNRMASNIGSYITTPYKYAGPYHNMVIGSDLSDSGRASGFRENYRFNTNQSGIKWARWSRRYQKLKQRRGNANLWLKGPTRNKGGEHLQDYLKARTGSFYEKAFGQVKVRFVRTRKEGFKTASGVTRTGVGGKLAYSVQIGRVEVLAFNKITPSVMPNLATMNPVGNNPLPGLGVAELLSKAYPRNRQIVKLTQRSNSETYTTSYDKRVPASDAYQKIWRKSTRLKKITEKRRRKGEYRPALDPFVSYYLMRVIPNSIFRRLEQEVAYSGGNVRGA